jgi:hypothetical protein
VNRLRDFCSLRFDLSKCRRVRGERDEHSQCTIPLVTSSDHPVPACSV